MLQYFFLLFAAKKEMAFDMGYEGK